MTEKGFLQVLSRIGFDNANPREAAFQKRIDAGNGLLHLMIEFVQFLFGEHEKKSDEHERKYRDQRQGRGNGGENNHHDDEGEGRFNASENAGTGEPGQLLFRNVIADGECAEERQIFQQNALEHAVANDFLHFGIHSCPVGLKENIHGGGGNACKDQSPDIEEQFFRAQPCLDAIYDPFEEYRIGKKEHDLEQGEQDQ